MKIMSPNLTGDIKAPVNLNTSKSLYKQELYEKSNTILISSKYSFQLPEYIVP